MALSELQRIAVKMLNDGATIGKVAEEMQLKESMVRRWCYEPAFAKERYMDMSARFSEYAPEAMSTIRGIMNDIGVSPNTRLKAAVEILDRSGYAAKKDITVQVESKRVNLDEHELRQMISVLDSGLEDIRRMKDATPVLSLESGEEADNG